MLFAGSSCINKIYTCSPVLALILLWSKYKILETFPSLHYVGVELHLQLLPETILITFLSLHDGYINLTRHTFKLTRSTSTFLTRNIEMGEHLMFSHFPFIIIIFLLVKQNSWPPYIYRYTYIG